jgi:MFS family permease
VWGWVALGASALLLVAFALVERAVARSGGSPLIPAAVLLAPDMVTAALAIFLAMGTFGGFLFSLALHLQSGLGDSPLRAGFTFVPAALGFATGSLTWQRLPDRWHRALIPLGATLAAASYGATAMIVGGGDHGGIALVVALAVNGIGFGYSYTPILTLVLRHVAPVHAPDASGLLVTTVQLGQVVGIATFGTLFLSLVDRTASPATTHAIAVTSAAMAATTVVVALLGLRLATNRAAQTE